MEKAKDASRVLIIGCHPGSHEIVFADILNTIRDCITIVSPKDAEKFKLESIDKPGGSSAKKNVNKKGKEVVIAGAGISGLAAASVFANRHVKVHIVEKEARVGGSLARVVESNGLDQSLTKAFIDRIMNAPNIDLITNAEVVRLQRSDGRYELHVRSSHGESQIRCDALLIATGAQVFKPQKYGYGSNPRVITQDEFYGLISAGSLEAETVAVIQCVGARDEHPHCSRYCCRQALRNAIDCKTKFADTRVVVVHKGLRLFGFDECLYNEACDKGVEFIQSSCGISLSPDGSTRLLIKDGKNLSLEADLAVLSVGHCQVSTYSAIREMFGVDLDGLGFVRTEGDPLSVHRTIQGGIYVCGFARQPMVAESAFIDGLSAGLTMLRDIG